MAEKKKVVKTKEAPVAAEPAPTKPEVVADDRPGWGLGSIFWGLLLITIGVLALLNNFGVISLNLAGLSQLWPLLFVVWGVSMLSFRSTLWRSVMVLLVVAVLGFVVWVAVGTGDFSGRQATVRQDEKVARLEQSARSLELRVDAGASKVRIDSEDMTDELRASLDSNVATLKKTTSRSGDVERINLSLESKNQWWIAGVRNELDVTMARRLPSSLILDLGAADLNADLSEVKLDKLTLDIGAASAGIRLGTLQDSLKVSLDAGASSIKMHIPKDSGVRVEIDGGVSSREFEGLDKKGDGIYESPDYAAAEKKVIITGSTGATSFEIIRY